MTDKKTTLGLLEETLYNFNCAKIENKFRSADGFLLFLLEFFARNSTNFKLKPLEKQKVYKEQQTNKSNNYKKKMGDKNNKQIQSLEELKKLAGENLVECYICLNGGCRSSKNIQYNKGSDDGKDWSVFNLIDDSFEELTEEELKTKTNIVEAINKGALYLY